MLIYYIKLVFFDRPINFGDFVSPYLVSKLTGKRIIHKNFYEGYKKTYTQFKLAIKSFNFIQLVNILYPFESNYLVVGSILSQGNSRSKIWGSGFIDESQPFRGGQVFAVRGKYSALKLQKMGFPECNIYGDPALLLPLIYNPLKAKQEGVGIVAHIIDAEKLIHEYGSTHKVIDLRSSNIEGIIDEITSCEFILSTSLHGIIVAHAYGIPAIWVTNRKLYGDGIKFKDYFSSVNIPLYSGEPINKLPVCELDANLLKEKFKDFCLPHKDVSEIQKALLSVAPFKIDKRFLQQLENVS